MTKFNGIVKGFVSVGLVGLMAACGSASKESSEISVTNGRVLGETDYQSVVLLYDQAAGGICTGTFITPTVVLSAAHCTMSGEVDAAGNVEHKLAIIKITDPVNKKAELVAESIKIVRNPLWDKNGKNVNKWDLSLITFAAGVSKEVSALSTIEAKKGDILTIVGFGLNQMANTSDGSSAGVKRIGSNKVTTVASGFVQFTGSDKTSTADGTDSSSASGDSGGPLFIDGKVAGVTSGGGFGGFGRTRAMYINLRSPESQAFLTKNLAL